MLPSIGPLDTVISFEKVSKKNIWVFGVLSKLAAPPRPAPCLILQSQEHEIVFNGHNRLRGKAPSNKRKENLFIR